MPTIELTIAGIRFSVETPAPEQVASLRECLDSEDANGGPDLSALTEQLKQLLHPADWSTIQYRVCQVNDPFDISHLFQLAQSLVTPQR